MMANTPLPPMQRVQTASLPASELACTEEGRCRSLLDACRAILDIAEPARRHSDLLMLALHITAENVMHVTVLQGAEPVTMRHPADSSLSGWIVQNQQALVIPDLLNEQRDPDTLNCLRERGMRSACLLPLTVSSRRVGALGLASATSAAYSPEDVQFLGQLAELLALAMDDLLTQEKLNRDNQSLELLFDISRVLSSTLEFKNVLPAITDALRRVMTLDYVAVAVPNRHKQGVDLYAIYPPVPGYNGGQFIPQAESLSLPVLRERTLACLHCEELQRARSPLIRFAVSRGIQYLSIFPLITSRAGVGAMAIASKSEHICNHPSADVISQVVNLVAIALENAVAYQELSELKTKLAQERLYLEDEIRTELHFEEIVGESAPMKRAFADAKTVAASDANVLIQGETGTGKELIARAIHRMSARKGHSFIKLNCAAIPTGLLESELFGHEKGAFTGALTQKIGRLELANGGTVFLDEVGDIPLELQPKLLRVLQDQEFERLGSTRTIKVNVRLIAATNRDLETLVAGREFRSDLYYRLRVFPIQLPPLRERREDIPLLVRYFVQRLSRRMNKVIDTIPTETMEILTGWDWPGNVRELENYLERSVILSRGATLTIPATELRPLAAASSRRDTTLDTAEREHILRILREAGGVIAGVRGAASRLGLKRTTLQSKMHKLGISRKEYQC